MDRLDIKVLPISDYMILGSYIRPQCIGALFKAGRSCALGAVLEGATGLSIFTHNDCFIENSPEWLNTKMIKASHEYYNHYGNSIVADNDVIGLTREQIAQRLAAIGY